MDPQTFLILFAIFLLIVYLLLRSRRRKPPPQVRRVIRQPHRPTQAAAVGTTERPPVKGQGPSAKDQPAAAETDNVGTLIPPPVEGWKPLERGELEIETLWRLEHTIRDMEEIGKNQMMRVDFNMEPKELATVLASNPFYAARILKTVNSAAVGLRTRIDSLQRAITFLGYNQVKNIVFQHMLDKGMAEQQSQLSGKFELLKFWMHSHAVSICADYLLRDVIKQPQHIGVVTTAALLHDVGWVVFDRYDNRLAEKLYEQLGSDEVVDEPMQIEEELFGFNHMVTGMMLAEQWEIPRSVCEMIGQHHCGAFGLDGSLGRDQALGACVIAKAEQLSDRLGYGNPQSEPSGVMADLSPLLGANAAGMDNAPVKLREDVERTMNFIQEFNRA
ncbi:MAG: HDOD domain-containing protein [Candidatus Glassbacteria bacterium]|nr:HDOD domain-containing protein [Candidatus Glassbacteria bacterium]